MYAYICVCVCIKIWFRVFVLMGVCPSSARSFTACSKPTPWRLVPLCARPWPSLPRQSLHEWKTATRCWPTGHVKSLWRRDTLSHSWSTFYISLCSTSGWAVMNRKEMHIQKGRNKLAWNGISVRFLWMSQIVVRQNRKGIWFQWLWDVNFGDCKKWTVTYCDDCRCSAQCVICSGEKTSGEAIFTDYWVPQITGLLTCLGGNWGWLHEKLASVTQLIIVVWSC